MSYVYKLIKHIKIKYLDPICALDLSENILLFGSMLGYSGYYLIKENMLSIISEKQDENISSVKIKNNNLIIVVGDLKILILKKDDNYTYKKKIYNYRSSAEHYKMCENSYTMFGDSYLFIIYLTLPSSSIEIPDNKLCLYRIKNIEKGAEDEEKIEISNYWVPLDFDGKILIYIDFLDKYKRILNIFNFHGKKKILSLDLEKCKDFIGHISHIKILKNQYIFLVHNYINCEIRDFEFKLIKNFKHEGKEIIACDVFYDNENEMNIVLLDKNCTVSLYRNNFENFLFNLEEMEDIDKEIKKQKFFSMEFPYYIKMCGKSFAITTDQGCFLIRKRV